MRASALYKMEEMINASNKCENDLMRTLDPRVPPSSSSPYRKWWVPLLLLMEGERNVSSLIALQNTIEQGQDAYVRFKRCTDVRGFILLMGIEFEELQSARNNAIKSKQKKKRCFIIDIICLFKSSRVQSF